ncbi:hypothetical protein [Acidithiobacillus albertensis]|uniref:hypothetical protein n=1 Tax=Acidithiobacillus albertensis TaxID=119978 RepID=UPI00094AE838|nr:hypothetical protein [Acidithiobacillus albertensis]
MASGYKNLYEFCQELTPYIRRNIIKNKVLEICGQESVRVIKTSMDTSVMRGSFLGTESENSYVQNSGVAHIVLARGLNHCWERFVFVKELMHFFDEEEEKTTSAVFDLLLDSFSSPSSLEDPPSPIYLSEVNAVWMAVACFCPETYRLKLKNDLQNGHIDEYGIALKLKIPKQHVRLLMSHKFNAIIDHLIKS